MTLSKRTRIFNLLEGKPVDQVPTGFWLHFPEAMHHGDAAIKAHLDFIRQTDTDILKVMNENFMYDGTTTIRCLNDIAKFRGFSQKDQPFIDQGNIIKRICDHAKGDYPILATIHGLVASLFHATGFAGNYVGMGYGLAIFCRERPKEMKAAIATMADSLIALVDVSLDAGADGVFYAALGGEGNWFTHDEYLEFITPHEMRIFNHIKERTPFNVLHICKSGIDFSRYTPLRPAIVNWSVYQNQLSLTKGAELFPSSIPLGGFQDRSGVLVSGTNAEIEQHTLALLQEMEGRRFIVGSDCTLPTEISTARIKQVVEAVQRAAQG